MDWITPEVVPGPDSARELQVQQWKTRERLYDAIAEVPSGVDWVSHPKVVAVRTEYEATVAALQALLGDNAPCSAVDCDKWNRFSDCHKDFVGFRPSIPYTVAAVEAWFQRHRESPDSE